MDDDDEIFHLRVAIPKGLLGNASDNYRHRLVTDVAKSLTESLVARGLAGQVDVLDGPPRPPEPLVDENFGVPRGMPA